MGWDQVPSIRTSNVRIRFTLYDGMAWKPLHVTHRGAACTSGITGLLYVASNIEVF